MAKRPIMLCLVLCLIAGLLFTWPLALNFFSSIPYTLRPISGFERVPLMPGDHLQSYYWYWLFSDNIFGHSALLTNPYEFNGPTGPMSTVYANFPYSILYVVLLFLGPVGGYNGLVLLSFMLCGLAMFLLARTWTKDYWASLMAGLIFAVFPYRVSHIAGGQLTGHVIFFLPLCLYFIEKTLSGGRWFFSAGAGLCLVIVSLMDPHTSYLTALTIGAYFPSRILLIPPPFPSVQEQRGENITFWTGFGGALTGGLSISFMLWIRFWHENELPFWHLDLLQPLISGVIFTLLFWAYLSVLFSRLTTLSFAEARHQVGKLFFFFLPLWLYPLKYRLSVPRLGLIVILFCLGLFSFFLIAQWRRQRNRLPAFNWPGILYAVTGVGLGLTVASAYLMHIRKMVLLPSVASKGRTLAEVRLYSPKVSNFFFWQDINYERFVLLGWGLILLAFVGLIPLFRRNPKKSGYLPLAGALAFLATVLSLGPTLTAFPLYPFLYQYFPFFNYSRLPGRFVMIGMVFFCLLAGMALSAIRDGLASRGWLRLMKWFPPLIIFLILAENHTRQPLGISIMPRGNQFYDQIEKSLSDGKRVLELPVWPGDSHQSSVYEYTVTRTRKPMINGYAPVVVRDYIEKVFWPLFPLNYGELTPREIREMNQLKVDLITFHDDYQVYTNKISPFPPRLALKRLAASPWLEPLSVHRNLSLFKFQGNPGGPGNPPDPGSPVNAVFYAQDLKNQIGQRLFDPSASGFYLLLQDEPLLRGKWVPQTKARGNLIQALPGRDKPGYLIDGPARFLPSGNYISTFRVKTGRASDRREAATLEIIDDRDQNVLTRKKIGGQESGIANNWVDVPLPFKLSSVTRVNFRIYFAGTLPVTVNLVKVGFAGQRNGPGVVEAEDLFRQTGEILPDPLASRGEAVFGQGGYHPPVMLIQGPYRTFDPGRYRIQFYLKAGKNFSGSSDKTVAELGVASDMGKHLFKKRRVTAGDLTGERYKPVAMDFEVPFRCEVDFRVKFESQADVWIDRIEVSARP
ncbi:MAG: hypothetical protein HY787_13370 [Deltaproteobacteria bacterium]|nr:hypothetical protein [Deltaproteobacteria bacterium]